MMNRAFRSLRLIFGIFFATGLANAANAQTTPQAVIYERATGTVTVAIEMAGQEGATPAAVTITLNNNAITNIVFEMHQAWGAASQTEELARRSFERLNDDGTTVTATDIRLVNGVLQLEFENGQPIEAGNTIRFFDEVPTQILAQPSFDRTLRVYDDAGVLYFAMSVAVGGDGDLAGGGGGGGNRFFIDDDTGMSVNVIGGGVVVIGGPTNGGPTNGGPTNGGPTNGGPNNTNNNGGTGGGSSSSSSDASNVADYGFGAGVLAFFYLMYTEGDDLPDALTFAPTFGYAASESGYSYHYGGRMNYEKGRQRLYWSVGQANANGEFGDFRYQSGGEYKADLWTASFSESVRSDSADLNLAFSADFDGGIWKMSPTYRMHSSWKDGKAGTKTTNSLNMESVLKYDHWTIRPAAGFRWDADEEFGENAQLRLQATREF